MTTKTKGKGPSPKQSLLLMWIIGVGIPLGLITLSYFVINPVGWFHYFFTCIALLMVINHVRGTLQVRKESQEHE